MKKKSQINPPSKLRVESLTEKEQAIRELESKLANLKSEFNREKGEVVFNSRYEEILSDASKSLNIDRTKLETAFKENKQELVSAFKRTSRRPDFNAMIGAGSIFSFFTLAIPTFVIFNPEVWPALLLSLATGTISGMAIRDTVNDFRNRAKARQSIEDTVTSFQKRLPESHLKKQ
jgi:hypothetical protein